MIWLMLDVMALRCRRSSATRPLSRICSACRCLTSASTSSSFRYSQRRSFSVAGDEPGR